MKRIYILLFLLIPFITLTATAHGNKAIAAVPTEAPASITGTIIDSLTGKPVDYATIAVIAQGTSKVVSGSLAGADGKFTISKLPAGNYQLKVSFIGYANKIVPNLKVTDGVTLKLGKILLSSSSLALKEVQVTAKKALVEEKIDRTVYNAENDITARGGDATDVMKRVPMVSVDLDGNVSVRGSSNIKVLINGKPSAMVSASVSDALKQIPADLIKSVEVITSPSAKYDAEGSGGILNIVLKQNTLQGLSLNVNTSVGTRNSNLGLNGGYKVGKFNFSIGGFGRGSYNTPGEFSNSQAIVNNNNTSLTTQSANTHNKGIMGRYNLGADYDINEHNSLSLGLVFGGNSRPLTQDDFLTRTYLNDTLKKSTLQSNDITNSSTQLDATLTYTLTGKVPQREFSILAEYSQNNRDNNFESIYLNQANGTVNNGIKNINSSLNKEFTFEADYQTPTFSKDQLLEFGAKDIVRKVNSDYTSFEATTGALNYQPAAAVNLSNAFNYQQNVASAYLSYTIALPKNYTIRAGGRYEYTSIDADFKSGSPVSIPDYGVLVPSINFSKKIGSGDMIKLGYNRRIQRPSLEFLNPNIQSSNLLNVTVGNPTLQPEYTNNFELAYSTHIKNNSINASTFLRTTNDAIQTIRTTNLDTIRTTYLNVGKQTAYGMSLSANFAISNKLNINGGIDFYHLSLSNQNPDINNYAANSGWVSNYRFFGSYDITEKYALQAFTFHRSNQIQLQGYQGGFGIYSLSINRYFAGKKGTIGIAADNFLTNGYRIPTVVTSRTIVQNSLNVNYNRSFEIKLSYKIGGLSVKPPKQKKSINNDDMKDSGSGNNQQQQ